MCVGVWVWGLHVVVDVCVLRICVSVLRIVGCSYFHKVADLSATRWCHIMQFTRRISSNYGRPSDAMFRELAVKEMHALAKLREA